jgi:cyclic-di-GMP phosphodiesterase TipF (flagellum assembly factor)
VRFGQGFLFAPPRPLRPEGAPNGGTPVANGQEANGTEKPAAAPPTAIDPPSRMSGNAALARRAAGPG